MNLLIVSRGGGNFGGGIYHWLIDCLALASRQGFTVGILLGSSPDSKMFEVCPSLKYEGRPVNWFSCGKIPIISFVMELVHGLMFRLKKYDHVLIVNKTLGLDLGYVISAKRCSFFMHSLPQGELPFYHKILFSIIIFFSSVKFVSVSQHGLKSNVLSLGVEGSLNTVIHNSSRFGSRSKLNNRSCRLRILTVSSDHHYKNMKMWVWVAETVLSLAPDCKFIWVGGSCRIPSDNPNIVFFDKTKDISEFYCEGDIYFHPSSLENHCLSIIEAMSFGLPCVVGDIGGNGDSVVENVNGYLVPDCSKSLFVSALLELIEDRDRRISFSRASTELSLSLFSMSRWETQMVQMLRRR